MGVELLSTALEFAWEEGVVRGTSVVYRYGSS